MKSAFKQAIRWGIIEQNPFTDTTLPKMKKTLRTIWDVQTISVALDACRDPKLYVAMNLVFACSMRVGEILGLTRENTHISDEDIARNDAYIVIDKKLGKEEIIKIFPRTMYLQGQKTRTVLKTSKMETSIRKVNAQKYEAAFYSNPDLRGVRPPEPPAPAVNDLASLVDQLQKLPELREMLASILSSQNVEKPNPGV